MQFPKPQSKAAEKKVDKREAETRWLKVRREVLARDGHRCRNCKSRDTVDVHHVRFRSVGGDKFDTVNLCVLCRVCHCEIHAYRLIVKGNANTLLCFEKL
jgi:hypothetical protein